MPTASDLITYIGVPLTVLGMVPILYNFGKALWIRYKLSSSIPWPLRQYYTLITDPASGTVTVVAPKAWVPRFDRLFHEDSAFEHLGSNQGWFSKTRRHRVFYRIMRRFKRGHKATIGLFRPVSKTPPQDFSTSLAEISKPEDPWMPALEPSPSNDTSSKEVFRVNAADLLYRPWMSLFMKCNVGLRPYGSLECEHEEVRFKVDIDWRIAYAPRVITSWFAFVLLVLGLGVNFIDFDPKGKEVFLYSCMDHWRPMFRFFVSDDEWTFRSEPMLSHSFSIRTALAWVSVMCLGRADSGTCRPLGRLREGSLPSTVLDRSGRCQMPVASCHYYIETFANAAENMRDLLSAATTWMFYQHRCIKSGDTFLPVGQRLLETRQRILCRLQELDEEKHLEREIIDILGQHADSEALCNEISKRLRAVLRFSDFVKESRTLQESLKKAASKVKEHQKDSTSDCDTTYPESESTKNDIKMMQKMVLDSSIGYRALPFDAEKELMKHPKYVELRGRFDPHENDEVVEERDFGDDSNGMRKMAQMLLALSPWEAAPRAKWELEDGLASKLKQIEEKLVSQDGDNECLLTLLDDAAKSAKSGAFMAPRHGVVHDLFEMKGDLNHVYFL
ncbi:hypothetical protein HDK90DRAFT_123192 [Phyllosticta capitalensis]|uniref:Uncharacterized protein n=1 Tax=Phyllosticta capitalensis TaxID=121624 RepID=A0ABR1YXJ0_9PEZI